MPIRTLITTIAVAAAFLTFPVMASARFSDVGPVDVHPKAQPAVVAPAAEPTDGTDSTTVLVIAGLTLLAGAATGIGGLRVMQRRGRALQV
jgi:hypothetical protein